MNETTRPNEPEPSDHSDTDTLATEPEGTTRTDRERPADVGGDGPESAEPTSSASPPPPPRFLRRAERGPLAGVATGIADYFRIEPILVQAAFIAFTVFGGSGVLLYLAGWLLIPKADDPEPRPVAVATGSAVAVVFGALFLVAAASALLGSFSFGPADDFLVPVLLIGAGLFLLNQRADRPEVIQQRTTFARSVDASPPPHWAATRVDGAPLPTPTPAEPPVPVTSVTLAIAALVAGGLIAADAWTSWSIGAAGVIGGALAVVGGGLVFAAFKGRAMPLIPVGLLLVTSLFAAPVLDATTRGGIGDREAVPFSESAVLDRYELGAGPFDIDLRNVDFRRSRTIVVDIGAGHADILVPSDVDVHVEATNGAGVIELFGARYEGVSHSASATRMAEVDTASGGDDTASGGDETASGDVRIDLVVNVTFGKVEVRRG